MRLLRSLALAVTIFAVYFAQYILDYHTLAELFPGWFLKLFPWFHRFTRWLPGDLLDLALWLTILGGLSFGLLAPLWRGYSTASPGHRATGASGPSAVPDANLHQPAQRRFWRWGIGISLLLSVFVSWSLSTTNPRLWSLVLWIAALAIYVSVGFVAAKKERRGNEDVAAAESQLNPYAGWPYLLLILVGAGLLYLIAPLDIPARTDTLTALIGIGARSVFPIDSLAFFTQSQLGLWRYAYFPTAVASMIT